MSGGGSSSSDSKKCGLLELLVFIAAIVAGTACSILSKTMMGLHGVGITGEIEQFEKPIFQTLGMFCGMTFGLVMHFVVLACRIPFPGYDHPNGGDKKKETVAVRSGGPATEKDSLIQKKGGVTTSDENDMTSSTAIPVWMYFFLAIPAIFDLGATALCMMGLQVSQCFVLMRFWPRRFGRSSRTIVSLTIFSYSVSLHCGAVR